MQTHHSLERSAAAPRFAAFVEDVDRLLREEQDEPRIRERGAALLADLVAHDDWLAPRHAEADPARYRQFALHVDPAGRFSVVAFVWGPGQATPVHDHTVWGLIGVLRGAEEAQGYRFVGPGRLVEDGPARRLERGDVGQVSPMVGDVHRVRNAYADRTSISIHVYGGDIGALRRGIYDADGERRDFVSGYTPDPAAPATWPEPPLVGAAEVRRRLLTREEVALLDVREEDEFARGHPLWAANLPLGRLELDAWGRLPRRDTAIVVYGRDGTDDARVAARRLAALGYTQVGLLEGGLAGWRELGGELFIDVNVPSKSFGEWLEARRHTPSLPAEDVQGLIDRGEDLVILDARRFDEYQVMSIPGAISVPGAELVLRVRELAPDPRTRVVVNCAGRTRSLVGAQSLVNAGIPNPVAALRNGTIGWTLAGQALEHGASRRAGPVGEATREAARRDAAAVAKRAGVLRIDAATLARWRADPRRTTYLLDVRTPEEYTTGHLAGFRSAPGGQLVQETDHHAPVRGARLVLVDHDGTPGGGRDAGVRAPMTASWLAQMGWEVALLEAGAAATAPEATGADVPPRPAPPSVASVSPAELHEWLERGAGHVEVLDVTTSANYVRGHVPGAWFVLRSRLADALAALPRAERLVLTCATSVLAWWAARDLQALLDPAAAARVAVLEGGTQAWAAQGLPLAAGEERLASPRIDRYRRPYEGTEVPRQAMQDYLDWEFGLVAQLERDGTHFFEPI